MGKLKTYLQLAPVRAPAVRASRGRLWVDFFIESRLRPFSSVCNLLSRTQHLHGTHVRVIVCGGRLKSA